MYAEYLIIERLIENTQISTQKMPSELKLFNSNWYTYQPGNKNSLPICSHLHRCYLICQKENIDFLFPLIFLCR